MNLSTSKVFLFLFFISTALNGQNKIFISDSGLNMVRSFDLLTQELTIIDDDINTPRGIRVDNTSNFVFYTNGSNDNSIRKFTMETANVENIVSNLDNPSRLALDESAGVIYFTERLKDEIYKINYDGAGLELIGTLPVANIIEIDTSIGKIFVSASANKIYSMNLDGSSSELVHTNPSGIFDFNLDIQNKQIYYVKSGIPGTVIRMNYDGTESEVAFEHSDEIVHIELDCATNKMYFITRGSGAVFEQDLSTGVTSRLAYIDISFSGAIALEQINTCLISNVINHYNSSDFAIYPNPVGAELKILLDDQLPEKYSILDINSRIIDSGAYKSNLIDVSSLQPGQYLLLLSDGNNSYVSKFVKM